MSVDAEVLVVDDDPSVRAVLVTLLRAEGYAVREAQDGPSAVAALGLARPDAVVLDLRMPGMDGHEVLELVRAADGGPDLPVVMLTGVDDDSEAWRAWSQGVDCVLTKPFEPVELLGYLEHVLAARTAPDETAALLG